MTESLCRIREHNRMIGLAVRFLEGPLFPIFFAILCFCSSFNGKAVYVPIFWFFCLTVVFAALFVSDNKVFLTPMIMIYYGLGQDHSPKFNSQAGDILISFDSDGLIHLYLCGAVMVAFLLARFALDGTLRRIVCKRGLCFWSILAMAIAFLCNGILSRGWTPITLLFGAFFAMGLVVFYGIVLSMLEHSHEPILYGCKVLVCNSYLVLAQFSIVFFRAVSSGTLFKRNPYGTILEFNRGAFQLPWGISVLVGAVLILGIPAAFYLAKNRRFGIFFYFSAFLFYIGCFATNTRSAILVGGLILLLGAILCCTDGSHKKLYRRCTLLLVIAAVLALSWVQYSVIPLHEIWKKLFSFLRFHLKNEGQRPLFWLNGWQDFLRAPLFGVGFAEGAYETLRPEMNVFSRMYHNVIVEFLGAAGLSGILAFLLHLRHLCELFFRRFTVDKLLLLMPSLMILGMSLVDNFFFYLNFQIIYAVFLALTEHELERLRRERLEEHRRTDPDRKPRVVFTYVEAGKGHIVPERAVCNAFRAAYGDSAEIVESAFYTETGDPRLESTERLFAGAVKRQNKSGILSGLCRAGNLLCGDCLALYFLMTQTISGRRSRRLAMEHLEELDADLLFTTHWATAFYANRLRENRPYVVCLCPDAYSNGMFNVDVNQFLIPSAPGLARAERRRMYAGGNARRVSFPIRSEAYGLLGKKNELRASLGIGEQEFVVTLSDGGYGMARLARTVRALRKRNIPMTLIALCGTNRALYEALCALPPSPTVRLIPVPFTDNPLPYIAVADLFCGKSGANSMAEPAFFGVPILITKCITYIEKDIKRYYVRSVGGALYLPSVRRSTKQILDFAEHPQKLAPYRDALEKLDRGRGAEEIADLLWETCEHISS